MVFAMSGDDRSLTAPPIQGANDNDNAAMPDGIVGRKGQVPAQNAPPDTAAADGKTDDFAEDPPRPRRPASDTLVLAIDGFEGPIDLLLALARDQKVDLVRISILELADQYLVFIARARELKLEIAADYLVMASWLAYLKSRLLLPRQDDETEEDDPAEMAARLAFHLQRLDALRQAGQKLLARPRLGRDALARGEPSPIAVIRQPKMVISLFELLKIYGTIRLRADRGQDLQIAPMRLFSMDRALERLRRTLGATTDWTGLQEFLPIDRSGTRLMRRSAMAATFAAALELARRGAAEIRQSGAFAPIYLRAFRGVRDHPPEQD